MRCRFCNTETNHVFVDLGAAPPSNSYLTREQLNEPEVYYPLKLYVCDKCWLVQVDEVKKATEIFNDDYAYYSSTSKSWVEHAREYVEMVIDRFKLGKDSRVLEVGSNDGYLLQWFQGKVGFVRGYEPSKGAAKKARNVAWEWFKHHDDEPGIKMARMMKIHQKFFNTRTCRARGKFDLICGINVIAHQPDINDFVKALRWSLAPGGVITMEFPSLQKLVDGCLWDTIYHEHYSYFSFTTIYSIFKKHGLQIFDVEELDTHGGSFRIYAQEDLGFHNKTAVLGKVGQLLLDEYNAGMTKLDYYLGFWARVDHMKHNFLDFLLNVSRDKIVVGYGAAAKASTFLNYCGVGPDLLPVVFDKAPEKVGKYMPGSRIPIESPDELQGWGPDYVIIFAWNMTDEIRKELDYIRQWGGKFVLPHTMEVL